MGLFCRSHDSPYRTLFGKGGIYIIRKFFGIILLAISVRLFTVNINLLIEALQGIEKGVTKFPFAFYLFLVFTGGR